MDDSAVDSPHAMRDDDIDDMFSHPSESTSAGESPAERRGRGRLAMVGLLAAGAAVGAIAVTQINHHSSASTTTSSSLPVAGTGQGPGATGQAPGTNDGGQLPGAGPVQGGPGGGGLDAEQRLAGTVTSVGSSSVTVKTSSGTATYRVTSASEIVRNGQAVSLSAIKSGDAVFVHVYPSDSAMVIERLFAGTSATAGKVPVGPPPAGATTQNGQTSTM